MVITRNQYMILKFLLSNQNKCSYFQLLNQTGCNKEELDAALHDLQYNMRGILHIEKKKEVVKAEIKDKEKLFALMDKKDNILDRNIKEERYNQIVNRLIRYKDKGKGYVSLERLAEDLFISRSTLIKDMSVVKHSISAYQLSIKGITKKGITINGNETNIRLFILNHFFQLYRDSQAHPVCLHNRILYLIEEIANHFMIDQHTKEIFERVIQITIIRCGFNQHILQSTAYFHSSYQEDPLLVELKAGISALVEINDYDSSVSRLFKRLGKWITGFYIWVFRGTPMMVQAMFLYYLLKPAFNWTPLVAGLFIISINTGAYMAEIIRAGIQSVDAGQSEAAKSLGMTTSQTLISVIFPQAIKNTFPSIGNQLIVNIKDSSMLNVISVTELYFQTTSVAGSNMKYIECFLVAAIIYLFLTTISTFILNYIEKRLNSEKQSKDFCS